MQGVNALLRTGYSIDFLTNYHLWHWNHFRGRELRVNFFKPRGAQDVARAAEGSLYIVVKGPAVDVKIFDSFLFLRIPPDAECFRPANPTDASRLGTVLLSKKCMHKLYVAGIVVQKEEKKLHHGYDIPNLRLTRDREVPNSFGVALAITYLWGSLLPVSSQARVRYIKLFETSPTSLDVCYAKYYLDAVSARSLFQEIREMYTGCWFCRSVGGVISPTERVIIQNCLKLQPKGLHEDLWGILCDKYHLVKTAEAERRSRFSAAPPTRIISSHNAFAEHTLHLLRIFLALDEETRNINISFVAGDECQGLEYVSETSVGKTRFLINDRNLHARLVDHPACMVYRYHPSENVAVPEGYTCSCSAIKIANLIYDEALQSRASADRHCLSSFLQNLVPWIPIDVCSEPVWEMQTTSQPL